MKSLQDLEEIRKRTFERVNQRKDRVTTRIVIGMATCGIAAGARPVLMAIMDEINRNSLSEIVVAQTGCIGACSLEPIVEVIKPGEEKVTYVRMDSDKAKRVIQEHIIDGNVVAEFTMKTAEEKILNDFTLKE